MAARDLFSGWLTPAPGTSRQPNDVDKKRIARLLEKRERYQYVSPSVEPVENGYRIVSPCCSRNIDPDGGEIDIALLCFDENRNIWTLFRKDHARNAWCRQLRAERLDVVMNYLNLDPERVFWQ